VYRASRTLSRFHHDDSFVRGVMGPFGSGKSSGAAWECLRRMHGQAPFEGVRRTRGAIVRNTYRELVDTVLPTWENWFAGLGELHRGDMLYRINRPGVYCEILFRALDKPSDVKKLLSLELTWAWVNEAREIPLPVIDVLGGRLGRYPPMAQGGPSWFGMWMDTNPPDEQSWWYQRFEEARPKNWRLFRQPGGLTPGAENVENLPPGYYDNMAQGKSPAWCKVYIDGEYGFVGEDGQPIYGDYVDTLHCREFTEPERGTVYVGCDFGLTPAAVFATRTPSGGYRVRRELVTMRMGASRFAVDLAKFLREHYPPDRWEWHTVGDPAGVALSSTDELTPFIVLGQAGVPARPAYTNDRTVRQDAVGLALRTLTMGGEPALLIHSDCKMLRIGMNGGYRLKRVNVSGAARYTTEPDKNIYSHVSEALQYMLLGAGEGHDVVKGGPARFTPMVPTEGGAQWEKRAIRLRR